jgi:DNA repair protein RecN (Recombination protein N)
VLSSRAAPGAMLKYLKISNMAVVASAELSFGPGLTLLTGETGAGKSILVDALGLLAGGRASAELIRTGESQVVVEAVLDGPGIAARLKERGLPAEGDEVVVRREFGDSGRGRATLNGALVPIALLREMLDPLLEILGQTDQRGLLMPETHVELLDTYAGLLEEADRVASAFAEFGSAEAALRQLRDGRRELERRIETLEFQAREIEQARLSPGEEEALRRDKARQANADRLAQLSAEAFALLYDDEEAVAPRLRQALRRIEQLAQLDPSFAAHVEAGGAMRVQVEELSIALRDYREAIGVEPGRLDEIENRLALIERLKRKYGASVEEVLAFGARCRRELAELASPEERTAALEEAAARARRGFLEAASSLSKKRRAAARELEARLVSELAELAMEKARFQVRFDPERADPETPATWTPQGLERAEFLLSPNPGEELRPLARIASGGELSRVLLALESVASRRGAARTLVFDEVDAGIGGRVAEVVGRKLRSLAARHQVLCVTHLPQIAAQAETHHVVAKRVERGRTVATVTSVSGGERVEELARMLAGETITEAARRHAREMLKQSPRS